MKGRAHQTAHHNAHCSKKLEKSCRRANVQVSTSANLRTDNVPGHRSHQTHHHNPHDGPPGSPGCPVLLRMSGRRQRQTPDQGVHGAHHEPLMTAPGVVKARNRFQPLVRQARSRSQHRQRPVPLSAQSALAVSFPVVKAYGQLTGPESLRHVRHRIPPLRPPSMTVSPVHKRRTTASPEGSLSNRPSWSSFTHHEGFVTRQQDGRSA